MNKVYYGQQKCNHPSCKNGGYFSTSMGIRCGVHSRNIKRSKLPKMPKAEEEQLEQQQIVREKQEIEQARASNIQAGVIGNVIVTKLKMMSKPDYHQGFLKVFPNNRHQNRKDGFGCCSLSPMRLGPVDHGQPGLPPAKNIENFHQGSKCFDEECIPGPVDSEEPGPLFEKNRLEFYNDSEPHRHKYIGKDPKNKNIPKFFVWVDKQKQIHKLDYVSSRQFYCTFYERLASQTEDFAKLQALIANGTNIQIVGYDGRSVGHRPIEEEYLDSSAPFGHELVLYTMLTCQPSDYPWRNHKSFDF